MYEIRYAYPSSEMAKTLGRITSGCHYVVIDGVTTNKPFDLLSDAIEFAKSTGHFPAFYSIDVYKGGV